MRSETCLNKGSKLNEVIKNGKSFEYPQSFL